MRHRLPASGLGRGAVVVGGAAAERMAQRMLDIGYVVEVLEVGDESLTREQWIGSIKRAIDDLLESGVVTGEQVVIVAAGDGCLPAIWASTLETRIGAVVVFGLTPGGSDLQPQYRMADAAYMGHQGGRDPLLDEVKPASLEITMRDVGLDATFHVYRRGAARFFDPAAEDYDGGLEDLAWQRTKLFLERVL